MTTSEASVLQWPQPLHRSVTVPVERGVAFARFAERFGEWWPRAQGFCVFGERSRDCVFEPRVGGEIFENSTGGERALWGRVTVWEPPARMAFTWFPGRTEDSAQVVEIRFTPVEGGTRLDLEHRDWHVLGEAAARVRDQYVPGWQRVLGEFVARVAA